jgi:hypothetical protein
VRLFGGVDVVFGELPAATDTKFLVEVAEVSFHGFDGHMELLGDLPVSPASLG